MESKREEKVAGLRSEPWAALLIRYADLLLSAPLVEGSRLLAVSERRVTELIAETKRCLDALDKR